ncbi:MAG: flagellar basal body L-ring protein FlgH [Rhodobacteraceae bacterium]|jgi:flagellar L-ring protein precursor FlgH|nr:flagellar basal body L-ring protein FlgH [Paracoccaceae bacterium]
MLLRTRLCLLSLTLLAAACGRLDEVGRAPAFTPTERTNEYQAMLSPSLPATVDPGRQDEASLWAAGRQSLLGDRRAATRGDIMTVVIEIDDRAEISNSTERSREGSERMGVPQLLGIPQRLNDALPEGASTDPAVEFSSSGSSSGQGAVRRREKLTLRVAATVVEVLPNGVLRIEGSQEVRVNFEMRELIVSGYVRPADVSRQNEITYDKIAAARISYGGRGQITDVQQPRLGQQVADILLPF